MFLTSQVFFNRKKKDWVKHTAFARSPSPEDSEEAPFFLNVRNIKIPRKNDTFATNYFNFGWIFQFSISVPNRIPSLLEGEKNSPFPVHKIFFV